jgi:preprotein translocase subunit SecF
MAYDVVSIRKFLMEIVFSLPTIVTSTGYSVGDSLFVADRIRHQWEASLRNSLATDRRPTKSLLEEISSPVTDRYHQ